MGEISAKNPDFKKSIDAMAAFRSDEYLWWQVAEYTFDPRGIAGHGNPLSLMDAAELLSLRDAVMTEPEIAVAAEILAEARRSGTQIEGCRSRRLRLRRRTRFRIAWLLWSGSPSVPSRPARRPRANRRAV
jgi:hypothetical protein